MTQSVLLTHDEDDKLSIAEIVGVGRGYISTSLSPETRAFLDQRQKEIIDFVHADKRHPAYGFNRGFGHNVKEAISAGQESELQRNLIRSHSCGLGPLASREIVRSAMLLRAKSLARGYSGVRAAVVEQLVAFLNEDITPLVPSLGSVSASGDLAPLSHIALALIGEGEVEVKGERKTAKAALKDAGLEALRLEAKEGLALNNGVQYSTAIVAHCVDVLDRLLKTACITTSITAQVMLGSDAPFRADLHQLRAHPGAVKVSRWIFDLMQGSPIREFHRNIKDDGEIQDPYNIRCAGQILGAAQDLLDRARATTLIEANSVTDNPLILEAIGSDGVGRGRPDLVGHAVDIVSGGHFHGMPIAVSAYDLMQVLSIVARLSNMRCARYIDEARNKGLGSGLRWPGPEPTDKAQQDKQRTSSCMMIPEYVSAGLTNWLWGMAMPSHLLSISTDAGQEDHVSMAANVALRVYDSLPRLAEVLAIELAYGHQAAALRRHADFMPTRTEEKSMAWQPKDRLLSPVGEAVLAKVGEVFAVIEDDRPLSRDLDALAHMVRNGDIVSAATPHYSF